MAISYTYTHTVAFHETDMAGIVHFSRYFCWMEMAEHALLKHLELPVVESEDTMLRGWPRIKAAANFRQPVVFGDIVDVELRVVTVIAKAVEYACDFFKHTPEGRVKVGSGEMTCAFVQKQGLSGTMQAVGLSPAMQKALQG